MKQVFISLFILSSLISSINTQQEYSGNLALNCNNRDEANSSTAFLYTCNGQDSCQSFLIFKSEPPYNSVANISSLFSSAPSKLSQINNASGLSFFPTGKEVIVPVNCPCSGQYYQSNATFHISTVGYTYSTIANNTYQGLTTCSTLMRANQYGQNELDIGLELHIPLRCACPTRKQVSNGTKYLLTYPVYWDDNIPDLADRFNVSAESVLDANEVSSETTTLYPFTTILIPLRTEPSGAQLVFHRVKPDISPPPTTSTKREGSKKVYLGIGIAAAGCLLLLSIAFFFTLFLSHKKRKGGVSQTNCEEKGKRELPKDLLVEIASIDHDLSAFSFNELKDATDNFSTKSLIKGSVYRGVISGEFVAVKKMGMDVSKEVNMLNKIKHFNLIKLHGFSQSHNSSYLVFEYMDNGSLSEWLKKKSSNESQTWNRRIQIALDVANGLNYLHSFTKPAYVHKDVKSSNILLSEKLRAKIANFTLARMAVKGNNSSSTLVVGTRGYLAPEYVETGVVTPKTDVYAFGVVMLELVTGKEAVMVREGREVLLSGVVAAILETENAETELGLFIGGLFGNGGMEFALRMARLSLTCLRRDPESRPSMAEVVSTLLKIQNSCVLSLTQRVIQEGKSVERTRSR